MYEIKRKKVENALGKHFSSAFCTFHLDVCTYINFHLHCRCSIAHAPSLLFIGWRVFWLLSAIIETCIYHCIDHIKTSSWVAVEVGALVVVLRHYDCKINNAKAEISIQQHTATQRLKANRTHWPALLLSVVTERHKMQKKKKKE